MATGEAPRLASLARLLRHPIVCAKDPHVIILKLQRFPQIEVRRAQVKRVGQDPQRRYSSAVVDVESGRVFLSPDYGAFFHRLCFIWMRRCVFRALAPVTDVRGRLLRPSKRPLTTPGGGEAGAQRSGQSDHTKFRLRQRRQMAQRQSALALPLAHVQFLPPYVNE
jgi:hypothetical protein